MAEELETNDGDEEETDDNETEEKKEERPERSRSGPRRGYQRSGGGSTQQRSYQPRNRRFHRRKVCAFCADKTLVISWKKTENLRRFVADSGAIQPRRKSGVCARHQRRVAVAIKRARHLALFPYTNEHVRIMGRG